MKKKLSISVIKQNKVYCFSVYFCICLLFFCIVFCLLVSNLQSYKGSQKILSKAKVEEQETNYCKKKLQR